MSTETCDRCGHATNKPEWQEVCNCALHDEIERLQADKARLDCLESHSYVEATSGLEDPNNPSRRGLIWRCFEDPSLREAIDEEIALHTPAEITDEEVSGE